MGTLLNVWVILEAPSEILLTLRAFPNEIGWLPKIQLSNFFSQHSLMFMLPRRLRVPQHGFELAEVESRLQRTPSCPIGICTARRAYVKTNKHNARAPFYLPEEITQLRLGMLARYFRVRLTEGLIDMLRPSAINFGEGTLQILTRVLAPPKYRFQFFLSTFLNADEPDSTTPCQ